jgi:hypothetical protein
MAVPFLCCGMRDVTCAAGRGYWMAWRARPRMPAVVPTSMSKVMR